MIQIKPNTTFTTNCVYCNRKLVPTSLIWQGIHVVIEARCPNCKSEFYIDLPVGHALSYPFVVDKIRWKLFGDNRAEKWFGMPLLNSLKNPVVGDVRMTVEKRKPIKDAVILNCLDFLYGHCLLKLLNAEGLIKNKKSLGVVVIIPKLLRWMVPAGVSEIWTVDLPLSRAPGFYPELDRRIKEELKRFDKIFLSSAYAHPRQFDISKFTGISKYNFKNRKYRITFIWREDRPWFSNDYIVYGLKRLNLLYPLIWLQNIKIRALFHWLKLKMPDAKLTVAGIGRKTGFPSFIDDVRFVSPGPKEEKRLCKVYAESKVVIGVHGSNMLLPSAHAGMVLDLVPDIKLGNFAQDILYRQDMDDPWSVSVTYRFLPVSAFVGEVGRTVFAMVYKREEMFKGFLSEKTIS